MLCPQNMFLFAFGTSNLKVSKVGLSGLHFKHGLYLKHRLFDLLRMGDYSEKTPFTVYFSAWCLSFTSCGNFVKTNIYFSAAESAFDSGNTKMQ